MTREHYSDRNPPPNNRQLLVILGILVALIIGAIWALGLLLDGLIGLIPPQVERSLGAIILPAFEQKAESSPTQDTLNKLLTRLETSLPPEQQKEHNYCLFYIPDDTVNAIALPGDVIVIYQGLLAQTESENELMMVLGHELGHFAHRDHLRGISRSLLLSVVAGTIFGDGGALGALAGNLVQKVGNASFSQSQEAAADEFGLTLLNATYGQVAGATDFFSRMEQKEGRNLAILSTHPPSKKRVQKLQRLIKERNYSIGEKTPLSL
ncbi:M48 family metallopeptidase [Oscillatoria sp. FACHB-1406]|uniref:M48 family metallopeptidase n=1 Tax=Oscillatoria sp. FACHB-1406 TaxID=2692846 RepID=UPI0016836018|nr:M48 family metallopeptidase [Oscillatoria sp. FACHB-1406]MBD2579345.1 M48 family metallopeptidase [Oscillatoria sp. FACHB-1406]